MNHYQPLPAQALQSARSESPLSPVVRLGSIDDLETALADSWLEK
jgi:hypothetical protein